MSESYIEYAVQIAEYIEQEETGSALSDSALRYIRDKVKEAMDEARGAE